MVLSTAQLRKEYGPHGKVQHIPGMDEAWQAHQAVLEHHAYRPRKADTGARNDRKITGGNDWSLHAEGWDDGKIEMWTGEFAVATAEALDTNWQTNPYGPRLITDRTEEMCDHIEGVRTNSGAQVFRCGAHYAGNKDPMHDEIVCSRADLATGINWSTVAGHDEPAPPPPPPPDPDEEDDMRPRTIHETISAFKPSPGEEDRIPEPFTINLPPWDRASDYNFRRAVVSFAHDPGKLLAASDARPMSVRVACLAADGSVLAIHEDVTDQDTAKHRGLNGGPTLDLPKGTRVVGVQNATPSSIGVCIELIP